MKKLGYIIICMMFVSCDYIFDLDVLTPNELIENDYRLFKNTPAWELAKATRAGNADKMNAIIKENPDIINYQEPKYGQTLLMITVLRQQYKPFKVLLDNNADVNIHNNFNESSALAYAVSMPWFSKKFVDALVQKGANVNVKGNKVVWTPLIRAVTSKRIDFVELLIENGAVINYYGEDGGSAFSDAIMLKKYEIAYLLLQKGADYTRPIFYRNLSDSLGKGEPIYLVNCLKEDYLPSFDTQYKYKMKIVQFLQKRGVDYWNAPVPEFIQERIKKEHPNNWQEYIKKY